MFCRKCGQEIKKSGRCASCGTCVGSNLLIWFVVGALCIAVVFLVVNLFWPVPVSTGFIAPTPDVETPLREPPSTEAVKPIIDDASNNFTGASAIETNGKAIGISLEDKIHSRPEGTPPPNTAKEGVSTDYFIYTTSMSNYLNDPDRIYDKAEPIITTYFAGYNPVVDTATQVRVLAEIRMAVENRESYINEADEFLVAVNIVGTKLYISLVYTGV